MSEAALLRMRRLLFAVKRLCNVMRMSRLLFVGSYLQFLRPIKTTEKIIWMMKQFACRRGRSLSLHWYSLPKKFLFYCLVAICEPRRKEFLLEFTDTSLVGPVLGSFTAMGEMVCQYNCHSHDFCDMYNFNSDTGRCEILDARFSVFKMENRKGWIARAQKVL
jgi:hypothetical protein